MSHIIYKDNVDKLNSISKYETNWNGYGAPSVPDSIIDFCKRVINNLGTQPFISPTGRESIQLEYESNVEYLEFEVFKNDISVYKIHSDGSRESFVIEYDVNRIVDEVQKYLYNSNKPYDWDGNGD